MGRSDSHLNGLIGYPFPLTNGRLGFVYLPEHGMTHGDAERIRQMVDSLIMDDDEAEVASRSGE